LLLACIVSCTYALPQVFHPDVHIREMQVPGMPPSNMYDSDITGTVSTSMVDRLPEPPPPKRMAQRLLVDDASKEAVIKVLPSPTEHERATEVALPEGIDLTDIFTPKMLQAHAYTSVPMPVKSVMNDVMDAERAKDDPLPPVREMAMAEVIPDASQLNKRDPRDEMRPAEDESFDDDCDSPQTGELDVQESVKLTMNSPGALTTMGAEQDAATREVLPDAIKYQKPNVEAPTAYSGKNNSHESDATQPLDTHAAEEKFELPEGKGIKSKCSRNINGHDVMVEGMGELGDDCGMPEPTIPCETPGNSTRCPPKLILEPPRLPVAERMPAIPAPPYDAPVAMSVELVDYGVSRTGHGLLSSSVKDIVLNAAEEFGVEGWNIELVRNAGGDVGIGRAVYQLEDRATLVVYLSCVPRHHQSSIIVRLMACEDVGVLDLQARVEVPETDDVVSVNVKSNFQVLDVLNLAGVPSSTTGKVTYNGVKVMLNASLDSIHFANRSALIVYLNGNSAPSVSESGATSTSSASANNVVPGSGNSSTNGRMQGSNSSTAGRPLPKPVPVPSTSATDSQWPRDVMTQSAVVTVHIDGHPNLDFKMLVHPTDTGAQLFEALSQRIGLNEAHFNPFFFSQPIGLQTPMKDMGFIEGDIIAVQKV